MNIVDFITLINQLLNRRISTKIRKLKQIFLLGDFSINLLNYNKRQPTSEFLNCLSCKSIIPYVLQSRSLISHSKTLIDKFFFKCTFMWSNIQKHYWNHIWSSTPVFVVPNVISNPLFNKSNYLDKDWSQFNRDSFIYNWMIKICMKFFN